MKNTRIACTIAAAALVFSATAAAAQTDPTVDAADAGDVMDVMDGEFIVSGFVGGSHNGSIEEAKVGYGGAFDYLRQGRFGFEFLADFAPELDLDAATSDSVQVNNYMFNVIGAAPLGVDGNWRPYVSGGLGAITFANDVSDDFDVEADQTELGANIGFGLMGFMDRVGLRADIRYYRAGQGDTDVDTDTPAVLIDDVSFWRSSAGLAIRW